MRPELVGGTKPLLVGEANPYSSNPRLALFPEPMRASGGRLARFLGLSTREYLRKFDRTNLCLRNWSTPVAREEAMSLAVLRPGPLLLVGRRVAEAFNLEKRPFLTKVGRFYLLPHPSGRSHYWNQERKPDELRDFLAEFLA